MTATSFDALWPVYRRAARTVVVVDVVESVRLMELDEEDFVRRWQAFVGEVKTKLLQPHGGRLVTSTGDGFLLEFEAVPPAIQCAIAMQTAIAQTNEGRAADRWMELRVGSHVADVFFDEHDIYGAGVNLAARLAALAEPGGIVVSAAVRERLALGLDADIDDLGDCFLKHISEPVRAYRVHVSRLHPSRRPVDRREVPLHPTVAVIPFEVKAVAPPHDVIGELIADSVIARLSTSAAIRVVSRLSTTMLRSRACSAEEVGTLLGATFVVSGTCRMAGGVMIVLVEMADARTQQVVWAEQLRGAFDDLLQVDSEFIDKLSRGIMTAISSSELRRVQSQPLPTLEGFSLQLAGTTLMHRPSRREFDRSREVLEHLVERYPRAPEPRAWLAKWFVLQFTRNQGVNLSEESARALEHTRRAIDASPDCSLALAMEGFVHCHMLRDLDSAELRLEQALTVNPNDSLAWLFKCVVQGFRGEGNEAVASAERAIELSPLDPLGYYYDSLAASAALAAKRLPRAIELATQSLKVNRNHVPTLRVLAIAQVESGALLEAQSTAQGILKLERTFTVRGYLERTPRGGEATRIRYAKALREAGIPAG